MHRVAAALLITTSVVAFNGGMLRDAFGRDMAVRPSTVHAPQPTPAPSSRLMSLLIVLEALRQEPAALGAPKV